MTIIDNSVRNECCGKRFTFPYENLFQVGNDIIQPTGTHRILIFYSKDGKLYYSVSFNCGQSFSEPSEVLTLGGLIENMQVSVREDQYVITLLIFDPVSKSRAKKAATGNIDYQKNECSCGECKRDSVTYNPISVTPGHRPWINPKTNQEEGFESVDYVTQIDDTSNEGNDEKDSKSQNEGPYYRLYCHGHM